MSPKTTSSEAALRKLLTLRYPPPAWAFFANVRSTTGYGKRRIREADGLAMSLYPSRGLELHGFEIKVARNDWLRERKDPAKADEIARWCDRWYVVVPDPHVVLEEELPPAWGLLRLLSGKLVQVREAVKLDPAPWDRGFLAAILRRAHEGSVRNLAGLIPEASIQDQLEAAKIAGMNAGSVTACRERDAARRELETLRGQLRAFEERMGVRLADVLESDHTASQLEGTFEIIRRRLQEVRRQAEGVEAFFTSKEAAKVEARFVPKVPA